MKKLIYKLIHKYFIQYLNDNYFAWCVWQEEDIYDAFHSIGIEDVPDEAIAQAKRYWRVKFIDDVMCEDGWEIIDEAVRHTADELGLEGEE